MLLYVVFFFVAVHCLRHCVVIAGRGVTARSRFLFILFLILFGLAGSGQRLDKSSHEIDDSIHAWILLHGQQHRAQCVSERVEKVNQLKLDKSNVIDYVIVSVGVQSNKKYLFHVSKQLLRQLGMSG